MNVLRWAMNNAARLLARAGIIDEQRGIRTSELAWPRIITGFARQSQQVADIAMIGIVVGTAGIAGLGFAFPYWAISNRAFLGLSGGTLNQVSQRFGSGALAEVDLAAIQSTWVTIGLSLPLAAVYFAFPETLIEVLANDPAVVKHGAEYLHVLAPALVLEAVNKIASRVLIGADDSWTPMMIRAWGAVANVAFNGLFIFGLGLGVTGAALGTVIATVLVTTTFGIGFVRGRLPLIGDFPVTLTVTGPYVEWELLTQLFEISWPLVLRRVAETVGIFPLMAIVAYFDPVVVAAYVIGRRAQTFLNAPSWGFGIASSSLIGQELGQRNEREAALYARDIIRFAFVTFLGLCLVVLLTADLIARLFTSSGATLLQAAVFIRIGAIGAIGRGMDGAATGPLRASGDTRWPLYGKLLGLYVFAIPIAYLGTIHPIGMIALYASLLAESGVPAVVGLYRYQTGKWLTISREYRPKSP